MIGIVYDDNGTKKIKPLAGSTGSGLPLGAIVPLYTSSVPTGYLPCDGSTFDANDYPALYGLLGTNVLPDLRNKALMGANPSSQDTPASGNTSNVGDSQNAQLPNITGCNCGTFRNASQGVNGEQGRGALSITNTVVSTSYCGFSGGNLGNLPGSCISVSTLDFKASRSGASTDHLGNNVYTTCGEVRSANVRVNYVIKAVSGVTEADKDYVAAAITQTIEGYTISKTDFKQIVADSSDFADFQTRIAAMD